MNSLTIVSPYNAELLNRVKGQVVTIIVRDPNSICMASADVVQSGNELGQIILETDLALEDIPFVNDWKELPLVVRTTSFGKFRNLVKKLDLLRGLDLRVYLPCSDRDNFANLRILSSVGIRCGVTFHADAVDWEALADLMTYALLERIPHAPIEPFQFVAERYTPGGSVDWGPVYYDDPKSFVHLDVEGRVALSPGELEKKEFIAPDYSTVDKAILSAAIERRLQTWRQHFLENRTCARCEAWRVCLGKFDPGRKEAAGCVTFFSEMMDVVEQFQSMMVRPDGRSTWRP